MQLNFFQHDSIKLDLLKPGKLMVIGSKPSGGKSAYAIMHALKATEGNMPTLFFSTEKSKASLNKEILKLTDFVPPSLIIDDSPYLKADDISAKIFRAVTEQGIKLVVIDCLQLMKGPEEFKGQREAEVSHIAHKVKECAESLNVPIIATALMQTGPCNLLPLYRESHEIEKVADIKIVIEDFIPRFV